jgi:hypothetical protein
MVVIIESVNSYGHIIRQTIRRPVNDTPILRAHGIVHRLCHRNIRVMDADGHTLAAAA